MGSDHLLQIPDLYWRSLESGDLWYKSRQLKIDICLPPLRIGDGTHAGPWGPQGYLAHKKLPPSLGPPYGSRQSPTVGSKEGVVSYERGTTVPSLAAATFSCQHEFEFRLNTLILPGLRLQRGEDLMWGTGTLCACKDAARCAF